MKLTKAKILVAAVFIVITLPRPIPEWITQTREAEPVSLFVNEDSIDPRIFKEIEYITPEELGYEDFEEATTELDLLAKLVYGEARGESLEGKLAVASVVMNRLEDPRFGDTIEEVIYQKGQFDCVRREEWKVWKPDSTCYKAAEKVMSGYRSLPPDIIFFHNPKTSTDRSQVNRVRVYKTIGNHEFGK